MSAPPYVGVATLNQARATASRFRAEWLMLVHEQMVTIGDLVREAARPEARPLLKLSLRQLLLAQPGWGRKKADRIVDHVLAVIGAKQPLDMSNRANVVDRRQVTIGWLLDPRAGGRRYAAWLDAFAAKDQPAWPGFPYMRGSDV